MPALSDTILQKNFQIKNINLIEASAGTGKTYSIQTLFLRMVVIDGFCVENILVVTFTDAATKELRERLRAILEKCRSFIENQPAFPHNDPDTHRIKGILNIPPHNCPESYKSKTDDEIRIRRIRRALLDFDQASIYTIHGFCQRCLMEFAFECGYDFDTEVINSDSRLQQICNDTWRRIAYSTPNTLSGKLFKNSLPQPQELMQMAKAIIKRPNSIILPETNLNAELAEQAIQEGIQNLIIYISNNAPSILDDINTNISQVFLAESGQNELRDLIAELQDLPHQMTDYAYASNLLKKLTQLLQTKAIPNPFEQPLQITAAIGACQQYAALKGQAKKDAYSPTCQIISDNFAQLRNLAENDMAFYTKNGFSISQTREELLGTLNRIADKDKKEVNKAFTQIKNLKLRKTISWADFYSETTAALIKKLAGSTATEDLAILLETINNLKKIVKDYDATKRTYHEMTYDDILQRVYEALSADKTNRLHDALRDKYKVALVDEFQDTDSIQYNIFKSIFTGGNRPIFYVGDPKQAIYSFRGGDIFTYTMAARSIPDSNKYTLDTNYRSAKNLITAVNTIFQNRETGSIFGDKISYPPELYCNGLNEQLIDCGTPDPAPFKIWQYAPDTKTTVTSYSAPEAHAIYNDVADEIQRLLSDPQTGFATNTNKTEATDLRPIQPSDIAILTRRHDESTLLYRALQQLNIPAVRQAGENVFDSTEATEMLYLLKAMIAPNNISAVKTALASSLMPVSNTDLTTMIDGNSIVDTKDSTPAASRPNSIDAWTELFKEVRTIWLKRDFAAAFAKLDDAAGITLQLASLTNPERRIASTVQLHDLIQQQVLEHHSGPEAVLKWFIRQLSSETRDENDTFETKLESDSNAVQIMTIFKSKGLEFPIVFIPTMWTTITGATRSKMHIYHDDNPPEAKSEYEFSTIINFDKSDKEAKACATQEKAEEDVRMFYVAATRASHRTYLITGHKLGKADATLNRCLPTDQLAKWQSDSANTKIDVIQKSNTSTKSRPLAPTTILEAPQLSTKGIAAVDHSRGHASFSSIAPHSHPAGIASEMRDFDAADILPANLIQTDKQRLNIFCFPAGAHTGECWHRIFELLDFSADEKSVRNMAHEQLKLFGLDKGSPREANEKRKIVTAMVNNVLNAKMVVANAPPLQLNEIQPDKKLPEMAFDFSLAETSSNPIKAVLHKHWADGDTEEKNFLASLANWETTLPAGFMTGFIDLLFEHNGRYYILDWKSNRLNCTPAGFQREGLSTEICNHAYFLQYLIYTVAVHRHLSQCLGDSYHYDQHFGGVLYIFLRGVDQTQNPDSQNGIFYTKPAKALIEDLAGALTTTPKGNG